MSLLLPDGGSKLKSSRSRNHAESVVAFSTVTSSASVSLMRKSLIKEAWMS